MFKVLTWLLPNEKRAAASTDALIFTIYVSRQYSYMNYMQRTGLFIQRTATDYSMPMDKGYLMDLFP